MLEQAVVEHTRLGVTEIVVGGEPDWEATETWLRARPGRRPRNGSTRVSARAGSRTWVECDACGVAYALNAAFPDVDLNGTAANVRWTTACHVCGTHLTLWEDELHYQDFELVG